MTNVSESRCDLFLVLSVKVRVVQFAAVNRIQNTRRVRIRRASSGRNIGASRRATCIANWQNSINIGQVANQTLLMLAN